MHHGGYWTIIFWGGGEMPLLGFSVRDMLASKMTEDIGSTFSEYLCKLGGVFFSFFLKCLIEFASEAICA